MRFRFCGGLDCPDWVLAEITILSRMSSIKMKMLTSQVTKHLIGEDLDYGKVKKFTSDAKYSPRDVKASIAVLQFILSNAAKYDVDHTSLNDELQQLGLPKEHSTALGKVFADSCRQLQDAFKLQSMKLGEIQDIEWKVKFHLDATLEKVLEEPLVHLTLTLKDASGPIKHDLVLLPSKLRVLLHEMRQAKEALQLTASQLQSS